MKGALKGVRVIEMTQVMAGPYATMLLASCGAEVIGIDSRSHHEGRSPGSWAHTRSGPIPVTPKQMFSSLMNPVFAQYNRNKLSIALNMSKAKGTEIAKQLIKISDVVIDNLRPGIMQKWGLDYSSLKEIKSDIIMVGLQPMGATGPYRNWTTYGMNLMGFSGCSYEWDYPDASEPVGTQGQHADYIAAAMAATAILAALNYRASTGKGQYIDLPQVAVMASALGPIYMDYFVNNRNTPLRGNRHPQFAPWDCYRCRGDDSWCVIAVRSEDEWKAFCDALDQPPWATDSKFKDMESRLKNVEELTKNIEMWTMQYTPHQVMKILQTFGVAAGAVQSGEDIYYDIQLRANKFMVEQDILGVGKVTFSGIPLHLSETPIVPPEKAPLLGEHNDYVYQGLLGISQEEIRRLVEEEVIF